MSWNAHTDHIFGQCGGQVSFLYLGGPDGSKWGESGKDTYSCITCAEVAEVRKAPTSGLKIGQNKFMFLRDLDPIFIFNKAGKGAAVLKGSQYTAVAFASDGFKAEQCATALDKLKAYLTTLGYN